MVQRASVSFPFFFFNDTATTEIYTLSLHDALPIFRWIHIVAGIVWIGHLYFFNFVNGPFAATLDADTRKKVVPQLVPRALYWFRWGAAWTWVRSEEHTSELQSRPHLVCRLLLEKKKIVHPMLRHSPS